MWMKEVVQFVLLLQFVFLSQSFEISDDNESLPNIWNDQVISRMVREILVRDLTQEHDDKIVRRQYKRDIYGSASSVSSSQPTRKMITVTTQKAKKPTKITQSGNNKTKNRITASTVTKVTAKPNNMRPIITTTPTFTPTSASNNLMNSNSVNASRIKPNAQPTKYHYYPHHQQPYFLPECAIQQVCNAVYVRLNFTQPLCVCPARYRDPCSASLNEDDNHTITLIGNANKRAVTLAKTCEQTHELRDCRAPRDWSILALQNTRTGKSHYLVICKCPSNFRLEGPLPHDQPTYAGLPGINVYGMLCVPDTISSSTKWKIQRPVIHTSYRNKNSTIEAQTESSEPTSSQI